MPALIGAAASAFGAYLSYQGGQDANQANRDIARENRDWQQWMSGTAHRREVKDLIAAGLNPMLSVSKGGMGASTPQPSLPTMQNPHANSAQAAQAAALIGAQVKKLNAEAEAATAQAGKTTTETGLLPGLMGAQTESYTGSAAHHQASAANIRQEMTNFENRVNNLLSDTMLKDKHGALYSELRGKTIAEKLQIIRNTTEKMPAEIQHLQAQAQQLLDAARLLRLKVPEGVAEAAFWGGPDARSAQYFRHAPKSFTSAWTGALGGAQNDLRDWRPKMPDFETPNYGQRYHPSGRTR